MSASNHDENPVNRRTFLAAIPVVAATASAASAADAGEKLAIDGGKPVRVAGLWSSFPGTQFYDGKERTHLLEAYDSHSLFRFYGPKEPKKVAQFEKEFAQFMGAKYALCVTSGTAALHVGLTALGVGPGDEVILPAWAWHACYGAIVMTGALPVFAEVDESFQIDPDDIARKITPQTKAVMVLHLFGAPADMDRILPIAKQHNLKILEDTAQSVGANYHGKRAGTFGDAGAYSFQIHKFMTSGEGGCVITNDPAMYERAIRFHDLSMVRPIHEKILGQPSMQMPGINYRMNEMCGAVLLGQLPKLDDMINRHRRNHRYVRERIQELSGIKMRHSHDQDGEVGWTIDLLLPDKKTRDRFLAAMRAENVSMVPPSAAYPIAVDPYIVNKAAPHPAWPTFNTPRGKASRYGAECCPKTIAIHDRAASFTIGPKYAESDLKDIVAAITKVHRALRV